MLKNQDEKRQNKLCSLLCKCENKKSLLVFYNEFEKYLKDENISNENVALTLSAMFQGNIPLDKLNNITYEDVVQYLLCFIQDNMNINDMLFAVYGLTKIAKSVEDGTLIDYNGKEDK